MSMYYNKYKLNCSILCGCLSDKGCQCSFCVNGVHTLMKWKESLSKGFSRFCHLNNKIFKLFFMFTISMLLHWMASLLEVK